MPPIQLSRSERASLAKILERPREAFEIPADHREKLINYDLARQMAMLIYITPLGQVELLRQRFRGIKLPPLSRRASPAPLRPGTSLNHIEGGI
ncbi:MULTISPECIES: hypothetical protein [Rhodomicrobium]|uniref:hypothetical protein n=1 Tax=Rhodomicrobium TaxID=1068 RepID=UPI000B4BDAB5|nr:MULTISPECIES: hypothetical protein [Rhodomicrobium]